MLALSCGFVAFAPDAHASEPKEPPVEHDPKRYPAPSARSNLLIAGAAVGVGSYGIAYGTSYLWSDAPTADDLRLPVVGPMLAVTGAGCGSGEVGCGTFAVVLRTAMATLSGLGQLGGLGLLIEGLFVPTKAPKQSSATLLQGENARPTQAKSNWFVSPVANEDTVGFSVFGQF